MRRLDGRLRRHKRMIVSCFEKGAALFLNIYLTGLKPSHMSRRATDSRLALQSVTSQQLASWERWACARYVFPLSDFPCRVPEELGAPTSRPEGKSSKSPEQLKEAYLNRRVYCLAPQGIPKDATVHCGDRNTIAVLLLSTSISAGDR